MNSCNWARQTLKSDISWESVEIDAGALRSFRMTSVRTFVSLAATASMPVIDAMTESGSIIEEREERDVESKNKGEVLPSLTDQASTAEKATQT